MEEIKKHSWFQNVNWDYIYKKMYQPFYVPKIQGDLGLKNFDEEFKQIPLNSLDPESGQGKNFEGFSFETEALQK